MNPYQSPEFTAEETPAPASYDCGLLDGVVLGLGLAIIVFLMAVTVAVECGWHAIQINEHGGGVRIVPEWSSEANP